MKTDTIDVAMLSCLNTAQLEWLYNYTSTLDTEDVSLDLYSVPNSKAIQLTVSYGDDECAGRFRYIIDLDGIALRKES